MRIFDENLHMTEQEMKQYLKKAQLEKYGFVRSEENSTEIDEDGKKIEKKTIHYMATGDCSRVPILERILEQRLPEKMRRADIFSKTVKEVQRRINGRKTEACKVGLELHVGPNRCLDKTANNNGKSKRSLRRGCCNWFNCCDVCFEAAIIYADQP